MIARLTDRDRAVLTRPIAVQGGCTRELSQGQADELEARVVGIIEARARAIDARGSDALTLGSAYRDAARIAREGATP